MQKKSGIGMPHFAQRRAATPRFSRRRRSLLPKLPGFFGIILPIIVCGALAAGAAAIEPARADPPAASPAPTSEAVHPAPTATVPASPAAPVNPAPAAIPSPTAVDASPTPTSAPVSQPGTGSALIPHDLSPYGMFAHADIVVKSVMVGLALASLATWTILLVKAIELAGARGRARRTLETVAGADTLRDAAAGLAKRGTARNTTPPARLVEAALAEAERSRGLPAEGVKERAAALLARIEARAGRAMGRGTGLLATVGSVAPFVGLFGTVWGIMNAFIGISKTNTTNLAVVAPGIAEALLATATGLVAAIPAVVIFNFFARGITGYRSLLGDISAEVLRMLSRDLDRGGLSDGAVPLGRQAAE